MSIRAYNREAWDKAVAEGDRWTVPVTPEVVAAARKGEWSIILTPHIPVPKSWFPPLAGAEVLCLASGGGQQVPILAAAGARVTVLDNSPRQLGQDQLVADREGLSITTVEGDMRDLGAFADGTFDLIVHPCSNCFVEDVRPVWKECFRVLKKGGALLSGVCQPIMFLLDPELEEKGILQVKYKAPYSDLTSLSDEDRKRYTDKGQPLCFGHTLDDQIGGQLDAGFLIAGFYEDRHVEGDKLSALVPTFIATRAIKP